MKNETGSAVGRSESADSLADIAEEKISEGQTDHPSANFAKDEEFTNDSEEKEPWRIKNDKKRSLKESRAANIEDEDDEVDEDDFEDEDEPLIEADALGYDSGEDPLGEAYDLEEGGVLKPTAVEVRHAPWKSKISTPREFFGTEVLYRHDILEEADRNLIKGRYRIELKGAQGGIWTLTLGDQIEVVNRVEEADVIISMQQRDFLDLVNGALNPQLAILAKKIKIQGDIQRAIHFQSMLAPNVD